MQVLDDLDYKLKKGWYSAAKKRRRGHTYIPDVFCSHCFNDVSEMNVVLSSEAYPDSKVHGTNMGPIWGRQDPGGPHVGPMKFAIWVYESQNWTIIGLYNFSSDIRQQTIT